MSQISVIRTVSRLRLRSTVLSTQSKLTSQQAVCKTSPCKLSLSSAFDSCRPLNYVCHRAFTTKTALPVMIDKLTTNSVAFSTGKSMSADEENKIAPSEKSEKKREPDLTGVLLSDYEKRKLVITRYYKSMDEVPNRVSHAKMRRAGDLFRIGISISTAVISLIILMITIKRGQKHRKEHNEERERLNKGDQQAS